MKFIVTVTSFFSLIICLQALAQNRSFNDEKFLEHLSRHSKSNPGNLLFIHTDKHIYTNNENLWFSGYMVTSESVNVRQHSILSMALVREDNRSVLCQERYAMQDGLSYGSIALPDSLPPGDYQLIAYTNQINNEGNPIASFVQKLVIKSISESDFSVRATLLDSVYTAGKIRVKVQVEIADQKSKTKPAIFYSFGKNEPKSVKTDANRTAIFDIMASETNSDKSPLLVSAKYNDVVQYVNLPLPARKPRQIGTRFFPEGGHLVNGLSCTVGWETKTTKNLSVPVTGILYENERAIDTITTTSYGIGSFELIPDSEKKYSVRVEKNSLIDKDTIFHLPEVLRNGVALHVDQAVVNDTLRLQIISGSKRNVHVVIHDFKNGYASFDVSAQNGRTQKTVILSAAPKGLSTVTVLDEMGRPLAERIFFAHYDQRLKLDFQENQKTYAKREKVNATLHVKDHLGNPVKGIVSIACVQDNRIDQSRQQDIESYVLLDSQLGELAPSPYDRGFDNKEYLENILLVKGWRKYTWQHLMDSGSGDTLALSDALALNGKVLYMGKALKKPVEVSIVQKMPYVKLYTTDSQGSFAIPYADLLVKAGNFLHASVNTSNKRGYSVGLTDPFDRLNKILADQITIESRGFASASQSSKESVLTGMEHVTQLKEVIVKASGNDGSIYGGKRGSNPCGDYVINGTLYYPHISPFYNLTKDNPNRRLPVKGETYRDGIVKVSMSGGERGYIGDDNTWEWKATDVVYQGCSTDQEKEIFKLSGIYTARDFYGFDEKLAGFSDPQFLSTLYWSPGIFTNEQGEIRYSFYTGDITGKFRVVIQGVGQRDLIYGETSFEVK